MRAEEEAIEFCNEEPSCSRFAVRSVWVTWAIGYSLSRPQGGCYSRSQRSFVFLYLFRCSLSSVADAAEGEDSKLPLPSSIYTVSPTRETRRCCCHSPEGNL